MNGLEKIIMKESPHLIIAGQQALESVNWGQVGAAVAGGAAVIGAPLLAIAAVGTAGYCLVKVITEMVEQ